MYQPDTGGHVGASPYSVNSERWLMRLSHINSEARALGSVICFEDSSGKEEDVLNTEY